MVSCSPTNKNVGEQVTIKVVIKNVGSDNLPTGMYVLMTLPEVGAYAEFTTTQPLPPSGTFTVQGSVDAIPSDWSGKSLKVNIFVYSSKAEYDSGGAYLAAGSCYDLIVVS